MRVAVITDIHANLPALEAALARMDELGVDALYCGGDLVGYGPHPNEVCALIEARAIPTIYGNYDYAIARDLDDCGCAYITPHDRELGQRSVEWTLAHTDEASKAFMRELPFDLRFSMGATRVRLVHGSPRKVNEYLFEDKPASLYERLAARPRPTCWSSATPTSPGCTSTAGSSSSTAARSASPRTATRARPSPCSSRPTAGWRSRSSGCAYDARRSPARSPPRAFPRSSPTSW